MKRKAISLFLVLATAILKTLSAAVGHQLQTIKKRHNLTTSR